MSMDDFMRSLSDQQKAMFLAALQDSGTPPEAKVNDNKDVVISPTTSPPKIVKDPNDFTMNSNSSVPKKKRRSAVKAGQNQWTDEGECRGKDVETPDIKPIPRNRKAPQKKTVTCNVCGSKSKILANLVSGQYYRCEKCVG